MLSKLKKETYIHSYTNKEVLNCSQISNETTKMWCNTKNGDNKRRGKKWVDR